MNVFVNKLVLVWAGLVAGGQAVVDACSRSCSCLPASAMMLKLHFVSLRETVAALQLLLRSRLYWTVNINQPPHFRLNRQPLQVEAARLLFISRSNRVSDRKWQQRGRAADVNEP